MAPLLARTGISRFFGAVAARPAAALRETYDRLSGHQRMLLEYKLFEPAFYLTDVPDWGTAYAHGMQLGDRAMVVIDTGHHATGTNIPVDAGVPAAFLR